MAASNSLTQLFLYNMVIGIQEAYKVRRIFIMDTSTGKLYGSKEEAILDGVTPENLVTINGTEAAARSISEAVKFKRRARKKEGKAARKKKDAKMARKKNRK